MAVRQARKGQSVSGVLADRLLEIIGRLLEICAGPSVPKVAASQVKLMRLGVFSWARRKHMFRRAAQLRPQSIGNTFRNVAFDRKNVRQFAVVNVGPEMCVSHR